MTDKKISATVIENGASAFSVDINSNGFLIKGDEPQESGGQNLGPAPYDLLLAALGECTAMTVRWFALQQKWPLEKVSVELTHEKKERKDFFTKRVTIEGENLSAEQLKKLHDVAAKCPVHRTLTSEVIIETY